MRKLLRNRKNKGFTLIELMIVVAIIGILAAIAIPNFLRFQLKSKTSEGKVNIAAIRTAEEAYVAEFGTYVASGVNPTGSVDSLKHPWVTGTGFDSIGWGPEGNVFFQYAVNINGQGYAITAIADLDNDGTNQGWYYNKFNAGSAVGSAAHGTECTTALMATETQVAPCGGASGQTVF